MRSQDSPKASTMSHPINHPTHYTSSPARCECGRGVECIQVTEHMNFNLGNAVKYIWRAGLKSPDMGTDLRKAVWYLERELARLAKQEAEDDVWPPCDPPDFDPGRKSGEV